MKTKAIAIRRVSSKKQEENNHSLEEQDTSVQNMATVLGAEIVMEWAMATSAKKGKNLKRKDLQAALNYCRYNRGVKFLLIAKVSRFMRELKMLFYYMVEFEQLGVKVIFCDPNQQKFNADTADAMYELAKKAHQAEAENEERSETSTTKMKARVRLGYYPFYPHQGYKKTDAEDGLHIPDYPRYAHLKTVLKAISHFEMTPKEALDWLDAKGYRTPIIYRKDPVTKIRVQKGNRKLDMNHFAEIVKDPYYAGILQVHDWPENKHGLHKAMITEEEWEINCAIIKGRKVRQKLQFNPDFRLNLSYHTPCMDDNDPNVGKLTGINHTNGKGWTRKEYVCRTCKKRVVRDIVHASVDEVLQRIKPVNGEFEEMLAALQQVWRNNEAYRIEALCQYKQRLELLGNKKSDLIRTLADNPDLREEIKEEIVKIKSDMVAVEKHIADMSSVDEELVEFTEYALSYCEDLRQKWWELPAASFKECKQLLFNDKIFVNPNGKVYTPEISPLYSLQKAKSDPKVASNAYMVELPSTALGSAGLSWLVVYRLSLFRKFQELASKQTKKSIP